MHAIEVTVQFRASHQLRLPPRLGGGEEPVHEHVWQVTARVEAPVLDDLETVMDFHELERALQAIVGPWEGRRLNDVPPFDRQVNPSAERVAEYIAILLTVPPPARVREVRVTEAPGCVGIFNPR